MKAKLIILFFITSFYPIYAQTSVDKFYFLMGTLDDYMGRSYCVDNNSDFVDRYSLNDPLLKYNYNLLKEDFPDLTIDSTATVLLSKKLAAKIKSYYDLQLEEGSYCGDRENEKGEPLDSLYIGYLKPELIKTHNQKLSYVLGAYIRYGKIKDGSYIISIPNSVNTFYICKEFLSQIGCNITRAEILERMPVGKLLYFEPSKELQKLIDEYASLYTEVDKRK
jgi:hypothetical protein